MSSGWRKEPFSITGLLVGTIGSKYQTDSQSSFLAGRVAWTLDARKGLGALPSVFEGGGFDFSLIILRRFHLIRLKRAFRSVLRPHQPFTPPPRPSSAPFLPFPAYDLTN